MKSFPFVLARVGNSTNTISNELYSLILAIAVLTMILTPFLTRVVDPLYQLQKRFLDTRQLDTITLPERELTDHIELADAESHAHTERL